MAGRISQRLQREQALWLRDWQRYMVRTHMHDAKTALEVGCGCGYVMDNLKDMLQITGIDSSEEEIMCAKGRGLKAMKASGEYIPFSKNSFDLVYGNYLLLWVDDPKKVLREMLRISRRYVAFFAEPYWSGAVYEPEWLEKIVEYGREIIKKRGGNPDFGLELGRLLRNFADDFLIGTIPLYTSHRAMEKMVDFEIEFLRENGYEIERKEVNVFYVPTFWAIMESSHR